jgi:hypothetical protein
MVRAEDARPDREGGPGAEDAATLQGRAPQSHGSPEADPVDLAYSTTTLPSLWPDAPTASGRERRPEQSPEQWPEQWPAQWRHRRAELVAALATTIYGATPAGGGLRSSKLISQTSAFEGRATRSEYELTVEGPNGTHAFDVLLHLPSEASHPVPVFLGLNFDGNQATTPEPGLRLAPAQRSEAVVEPDRNGRGVRVVGRRAVDATAPIGSDADMWPVREIVERGYGLATAHNSRIEEDRPFERAPGVGVLFEADSSWGVVGMWAWGMSRMLDALELIPGADEHAVIAIGHSRLGKAALWAAAQDERFIAAVSNDSGCAGASLFRHLGGESLASITRVFPHWFAPALSEYAGREDDLPVDQHQLLAAIAPRAVHVGSATHDQWADPRGEFLAVVHASRLFESFGAQALLPDAPAGDVDIPPSLAVEVPMQPPGTAVGDRLSYHLRAGTHRMVAEDWAHYLRFADHVVDRADGT